MIAYLDTSAVVPLFVSGVATARSRALRRKADLVVSSMLVFPETLAALARLAREGVLDEVAHARTRSAFLDEWPRWQRIRLDQRLLPGVRRVLEHSALTGADAVQLAAALHVQRALEDADALLFATGDRALARAAKDEGLELAW